MPKLDKYLLREFAQSVFAALVVLGMVSLGGLFADILAEMARGKMPPGLLLSQLGLRLVDYAPLILPLALMLGLLLALGRLYRDSEMPVLSAVGVGPARILRPLLLLVVPVVTVIALCSLWLGPAATRLSDRMLTEANRNLILAGLEPGRFTELPGGGGVVYIGSMTNDGTRFSRIFVYRQKNDRLDVTTAVTGGLKFDSARERFLTLENGFEVEGPLAEGRDYRLMRFASNDIRMPDRDEARARNDPQLQPTLELIGDTRPAATAQLHARIAPPLLALAFALLAVPLARSAPREPRYGRTLLAFLAYLVGVFLMMLGTDWLAAGKLPAALGLWWLVLPLLAAGVWFYLRDGHVARPRLRR